MAGRVPERGENIIHEDELEFEITDADPRRVKILRITDTNGRDEQTSENMTPPALPIS